MPYPNYKKTFALFLAVIFFLTNWSWVFAQTEGELRSKIEDHNTTIKKIEEEIKSYEKQVDAVGTQAKTLKNAITELELSQKKLNAEIRKSEASIAKSNLRIKELSGQMTTTEEKMSVNSQAVASTLNAMRQSEEQSLIEEILSNQSISEVLDNYESISQFQKEIRARSKELAVFKEDLADKKEATESEKAKLLSLQSELKDQYKILDNSKKERNNLLAVTKNQEAEYKKMLAQKQAEKARFEKELFDFESQLKRVIDPKSYPSAKTGVLSWPLDDVYITQAFGRTVDAKRLYTSGTHNGIDFRASRGTPIKSVYSGVVEATGNTDEQRGCYSYGKWVLIKHPNGLSSLYAHLDLIKVVPNQSVSVGELIGYSGQTGYATGPHLHLTLLASQGVVVQKYSSSKNCKNVVIPMSDPSAYLDPTPYF